MLWFVLASVPSLPFCTEETGGGMYEQIVRVIKQLLRVSHLRAEAARAVQGVDH